MDFSKRIENVLSPVASAISANIYLNAIRQGLLTTVPFIIFGAICKIIANFPFLDRVIGTAGVASIGSFFNQAGTVTMNLTCLTISFAVGYSLAKSKGHDGFYAGFLSLSAFLMLIPFETTSGQTVVAGVIPVASLGSRGMFIAIIAAILATSIYSWVFGRGWTIKMPDAVPENIQKSFGSLVPIAFTLFTFAVVRYLFTLTIYKNALDFVYTILQIPLLKMNNNIFSFIIALIFVQLFWFLGIHGNQLVGAIMYPIWGALSQENFDLIAAGKAPANIINRQFFDIFFNGMGGPGGLLAVLIILLFFCRSQQLKSLGKLSAPADIFNVMETIAFGMPIVLNPIILIPFILTPVVTTVISYMAMVSGIVPIAVNAIPWTTPPVLNGILATNSISGGILQLINIVIAFFIYFPFMKLIDKRNVEKESELARSMNSEPAGKNDVAESELVLSTK